MLERRSIEEIWNATPEEYVEIVRLTVFSNYMAVRKACKAVYLHSMLIVFVCQVFAVTAVIWDWGGLISCSWSSKV